MADEIIPNAEEPQPSPSLVQVAEQVRPKAPAKVAPARGDDLMAAAQAENSLGDDEKRLVKLFMQSKEVVDTRMQQDPAYAEAVMTRLQGHQGEKLVQAMIDEADDIKIEFLKKEDPNRFTSAEAANASFFNTASFGQLSRIMGGVGALVQGRPYEEVVQEQAEKLRLLQKAFPKSNMAGTAIGFLIPGSPVQKLFSGAAGLGAKGAGALLTRMANNPAILQKVVGAVGNKGLELGARVVESAAAGAAGAGAVGAVEGTLGHDTQGISFDRGAETALHAAEGGGALGAILPVASAALSAGAEKAAPYVRQAARSMRDRVASGVEQLTGVDARALRAYNARPDAIRAAAGSEAEVGQDLVDFLQNSKRSLLPESKLAREMLPNMGDMDASKIVDFMRKPPAGLRPDQRAAWTELSTKWADWVEGQITQAGGSLKKVPLSVMRNIIDDLQAVGFDKNLPMLNSLLRQTGRMANQELLSVVGKQGEAGATYVSLMEKAAEKQTILKYISKQLGIPKRGPVDPNMVAQRADGFVTRLLGKNSEVKLARMRDLDARFGTNFVERAQDAYYARQLGPKGVPSTFSNVPTGKAMLGVVTGGAIGGTPGSIAGAAASSPRMGAALIGASDKITGFIRRMVANPKALDKIAMGPNPLEVRRMAAEISKTLVKDGPISASGVTRLVADTPYFIGLVHAFDLAERAQEQKGREGAVTAMQNGYQPEIARKPQ